MNKIKKSTRMILCLIAILSFVFLAGGCNYVARKMGGSTTIELSEGERVENVTWKENSMWILTKHDLEKKPTTYNFKEYSNFEIVEGTVHIVEK